MLAHEFYFTFI